MQFMISSTRFWRSVSLACAVWCGQSILAPAQVYQFRNYTAADADGLSDNFVFSIQQDRKGWLWFATSAGVSRYDGASFKNFTMSDGLVNNAVRKIYEDRQGRLWFSTTGGLSCFEGGKFKNYTRKEGLPHDSIEWILEDEVGNFWIATRGGGLSYFDGQRFDNYGEAEGLTAKTLWALRLDRQGKLWIGSSEGLHSFDGKRFKNYTTREGLPDNWVLSLLVDNHDKLWVGTAKGLGWFDGVRFHSVKVPLENVKGIPILLQDRRGALWFGLYGQGLGKLEDGKFTVYQEQNGLVDDFVISLLEDREGNLWVGSQGGGVSKFSGERFVNYTAAQGLSRGLIHAVAQDSKGNYWFGSLSSGLCKFDGKHFTRLTMDQGLVNNLVEDIFIDSKDRVYVATDGGLSILEAGQFQNYTTKDGLPSNILKALRLDHQGQLWIGTFERGAVRFDGKSFTRYSSANGMLNDRISSLWEDRSRRIWFGTDQGVTVREGGVFRSYTSKDGLGAGKVGAIAEDSKGAMWFGTDSGLSRFDGRSFKTYSTADGLPNQFIHFLQFDRAGRLWIGSNKGVSQFDPSHSRFRNFSTRDGLLSNLMMEGASLLDRDRKLWFGSGSGVTRGDPDYQDSASVPPLVHLEDIKVYDQSVPRDRIAELRPEENQLTFTFVGLSFRDESRVRYRYFLENFDPGWQAPTNLRFAKYTNLPPGSYRFRVQSSSDEDVWSDETASAELRILPFLYQTPLFLGLALVAGAGLITGVFKWRVLRIRRLNQELEANVRIRTREVTEQKELLAQTNLELQALQNTSTAISGTLDKENLGSLILEASMSLLNCPGGFLIDYVWATQSILVTQALGLASQLKGLTLPVRDTISWEVIETRESRILPWGEIREKVTHPALQKMLIPCQIVMVPMISSNRVVGILALGREDSGAPFNERDLSLLTTFANQAAVATRHAELYQDMRASESKYRTLVEHAGDAIFVIDEKGVLDSVNPMALKLLGYAEQEFARLKLLDLVSPEHRERLKEDFHLLVEQGNLLESVNLLHKDGRSISVEINTVSLGNGFYQAIVRDITVRQRLEGDLAKQRDRAEEASRLKSEFLPPSPTNCGLRCTPS